MPVPVPEGVDIDIKGDYVRVKGPKGELEQTFRPEMHIEMKDGMVVVSRSSDEPQMRALHGLTRALINNMVVGVSLGYEKVIEV